MAVGDVYQIVDTQIQQQQTCLNVYYYKVTSESITDNKAADVVTAYITTVLPAVAATQDDDVTHTSVSAKNIFDDTDAHEELISVGGGLGTGEILGTFEAVGFRLIGDNASVRNGAKRYPGITESGVTDGVITQTALITALNALAAVLFADLPWGLLAAEVLIPVIVKRNKVGSEYELPTSPETAVLSHIIDALWSPVVTSQVSRKVGRGE